MSEPDSTLESTSFDGIGLDALERHLRSELHCLNYPPAGWVPAGAADSAAGPSTGSGAATAATVTAAASSRQSEQSDVVIVGAGMCGMLAWLALRFAGIHRVRIIDRSPAGREGPWLDYARMETLRSPKQLAGPAFGIGALTFQAWYRAAFGARMWHELDKIPRPQWMEYLRWYRKVLQVPVENGVTLTKVEPEGNRLRLTLRGEEASDIVTRKLVYATGRDGIAKPAIPAFVRNLPVDRWAHSSHDIDFAALQGRRVAVVGVGASAVDNAAEALEAGASEVRHLIRRKEMPTINKMMGIGSYGFVAGFPELPDEWRWRFMQYSFATQTPSPRGSTLRVSRHENAWFHFGKTIEAITLVDNELQIAFSDGTVLDTDFVILGTGFSTDPLARTELGDAAGQILLWKDVYTPQEAEQSDDLGRFPYLSSDFTFRERHPGTTPWLQHVYCFNYGATASLGKVSGDIPGISEGARWLARAMASRLYGEDIQHHWQGMQEYGKPELLGDEWTASELPERPAARTPACKVM